MFESRASYMVNLGVTIGLILICWCTLIQSNEDDVDAIPAFGKTRGRRDIGGGDELDYSKTTNGLNSKDDETMKYYPKGRPRFTRERMDNNRARRREPSQTGNGGYSKDSDLVKEFIDAEPLSKIDRKARKKDLAGSADIRQRAKKMADNKAELNRRLNQLVKNKIKPESKNDQTPDKPWEQMLEDRKLEMFYVDKMLKEQMEYINKEMKEMESLKVKLQDLMDDMNMLQTETQVEEEVKKEIADASSGDQEKVTLLKQEQENLVQYESVVASEIEQKLKELTKETNGMFGDVNKTSR